MGKMIKRAKVTVIICMFNAENTIQRCAQCLFQQTLKNIEYIFINDCSTDDTIGKLRTVVNQYPDRKGQIKVIHLAHNSGQAVARKKGIEEATGEYIIHCDSDDWIDLNMYQSLYENAIILGSDISWCDYSEVTERGSVKHKQVVDNENLAFVRNELLGRVHGALWNKLVKREIVQNSEIKYPQTSFGEDLFLTVQYALLAKRITFVDGCMYYYYRHEGSTTIQLTSIEEQIKNSHKSEVNYRALEQFLKDKGLYPNLHHEIDYGKYARKIGLLELVKSEKNHHIWLDKYPEINYRILLNPYLKLKHRIIVLMLLTRTYALIVK